MSFNCSSNPLPENFSIDSIKLLQRIEESSEDILRSKPIQVYLEHRWDSFTRKFYIILTLSFVIKMFFFSATFYVHPHEPPKYFDVEFIASPLAAEIFYYGSWVSEIVFIFYEVLQLLYQRIEYFQKIGNLFDLVRHALIIMSLVFYEEFTSENYGNNYDRDRFL